MDIILYNPLANSKRGEETAKELCKTLGDGVKLVNIREITDYSEFFGALSEEDRVILCGGDGTLNRFINACRNIKITNSVLIYPSGSGNDFYSDIVSGENKEPVEINQYMENLPTVYIEGREPTLFINGIGYGIDGYCCEVGDAEREKSDKPVNYASIAIKGMLGGFKPRKATVTVDGITKEYKKVWIAPTMFGRRYGGGMIPTPDQDRTKPEEGVTLMVWHDSGKLPTLAAFPSIFKGEHVKHTKMIDILKGHDITVEFDRPSPLQIDGETVSNVTKYNVKSAKADK